MECTIGIACKGLDENDIVNIIKNIREIIETGSLQRKVGVSLEVSEANKGLTLSLMKKTGFQSILEFPNGIVLAVDF